MTDYTKVGVGCILMFNDQIEEVIAHASEDQGRERIKELRLRHFELQSAMYPGMSLDDYNVQYIWHMTYAPILAILELDKPESDESDESDKLPSVRWALHL